MKSINHLYALVKIYEDTVKELRGVIDRQNKTINEYNADCLCLSNYLNELEKLVLGLPIELDNDDESFFELRSKINEIKVAIKMRQFTNELPYKGEKPLTYAELMDESRE